jgi:hypothetical protein
MSLPASAIFLSTSLSKYAFDVDKNASMVKLYTLAKNCQDSGNRFKEHLSRRNYINCLKYFVRLLENDKNCGIIKVEGDVKR